MAALKHVAIIGGGTAGWLTAGILAADHRAHAQHGLKVTVIESPSVPILGVGEGTWPSLRDTLQRIGIAEADFIKACNASFKQGSRFDGWVDGSASDRYYHPFDAPPSEDDLDLVSLWQASGKYEFSEAVGTQSTLCKHDRAPKQPQTPPYAAVANYAYHLDAPALATLLRRHCTARLGVQLIEDHVTDVVTSGDGSVTSVTVREHGSIAADLFVDCTGGRALLIGEAMGVDISDVSDILFNDRALAIHVPYAAPNTPIPSQTNATACAAGWVWDIALQTRRGIGYVYSSQLSDEDAAEATLANYLQKHAPDSDVDLSTARLLKFKSGYRETPWVRNVVAIGMSQGFVEPLEASAIVMIELSAAMLSDTLPPSRQQLAASAERYNARCTYRWRRIVDFLKLHYVLSRRSEPYWEAHRNQDTWPKRLTELVERWRAMPPSREDFVQSQEIFPAASYAFVLYGMGFETAPRPYARRKDLPERAQRRSQDISALAQRMLAGLPSNRELLNHICDRELVATP